MDVPLRGVAEPGQEFHMRDYAPVDADHEELSVDHLRSSGAHYHVVLDDIHQYIIYLPAGGW